jgi:hypothetical protein
LSLFPLRTSSYLKSLICPALVLIQCAALCPDRMANTFRASNATVTTSQDRKAITCQSRLATRDVAAPMTEMVEFVRGEGKTIDMNHQTHTALHPAGGYPCASLEPIAGTFIYNLQPLLHHSHHSQINFWINARLQSLVSLLWLALATTGSLVTCFKHSRVVTSSDLRTASAKRGSASPSFLDLPKTRQRRAFLRTIDAVEVLDGCCSCARLS